MIIQCACGCGTSFEEIDARGRKRNFVSGHNGKGKHRTTETRIKIGNGNRGKVRSKEIRKKISELQIGRIPWNKGKKLEYSEEQRKRMSDISKEIYAKQKIKPSDAHKNKPAWNNGLKMNIKHDKQFKKERIPWNKGLHNIYSDDLKERMGLSHKGRTGESSPSWKGGSKASNARLNFKRRSLGYERMNLPFENSVGHHINREQVVYIPEEIHKKHPHRLDMPETMVRINQIAFLYLMDLYKY